MRDLRKFLGTALLVLAALLLTFKLKSALGWSPDLIFPVLAAAGFFLGIYWLALLVLLTAWVLNWQVGLPPELWLVLAVPLLAWLGKRFMPSAPWLTLAAVVVVAEAVLYTFSVPGALISNIWFVLSNLVFAVLFGLSLMKLLEYVYGKE